MSHQQDFNSIFKKGSTTFFGSSLFFPEPVRDDVAILYAFVRVVDDYVDQLPQDSQSFFDFQEEFNVARETKKSGNSLIQAFVDLEMRKGFDHKWMDAFFRSMKQDLSQTTYQDIEDTEEYIYGSANIIGLCMAKILNLPNVSLSAAEMLGKSFQFVNFIRDISEDLSLGRTYLPQKELKSYKLNSLLQKEVKKHPHNFYDFILFQIDRYYLWQQEAEKGFKYLPRYALVPIKTASDLYKWTVKQIERDPFVVYKHKVKPSKTRVLLTGLYNLFFS